MEQARCCVADTRAQAAHALRQLKASGQACAIRPAHLGVLPVRGSSACTFPSPAHPLGWTGASTEASLRHLACTSPPPQVALADTSLRAASAEREVADKTLEARGLTAQLEAANNVAEVGGGVRAELGGGGQGRAKRGLVGGIRVKSILLESRVAGARHPALRLH